MSLQQISSKYCRSCGQPNTSGQGYCLYCGASLSNAQSLPTPQNVVLLPDVTIQMGGSGEVLQLPDGSSTNVTNGTKIGRDPNKCDVILGDQSVSREHAEIVIYQDGILRLRSLTDNVTAVAGARILKGNEVVVPPGAAIQLGNAQLRYLAVAQPRIAQYQNRGDFSGVVINCHESPRKIPVSTGLRLAQISMGIFVILGILSLLVTATVLAICSCAIAPILLGIGFGGVRILQRTVLGNREVTQISFNVQNPLANTIMPVNLFLDQGGDAGINDGDEIAVYGKKSNNILYATKIEILTQNGIDLTNPAVIKGKLPMPLWQGLLWLLVSLSPIVFIAITLFTNGK